MYIFTRRILLSGLLEIIVQRIVIKKSSCAVCSCVAPCCLAELTLRAQMLRQSQCEDAEILLEGIYVQIGG